MLFDIVITSNTFMLLHLNTQPRKLPNMHLSNHDQKLYKIQSPKLLDKIQKC